MRLAPRDAARFWWRVERTDWCWYWLRYSARSYRKVLIRSQGYGTFVVDDKSYIPHRLAYMITRGDIPAGLVVRHRCGRASCVNPEHLMLGTQADNMHDLWFHRANPGALVPEAQP